MDECTAALCRLLQELLASGELRSALQDSKTKLGEKGKICPELETALQRLGESAFRVAEPSWNPNVRPAYFIAALSTTFKKKEYAPKERAELKEAGTIMPIMGRTYQQQRKSMSHQDIVARTGVPDVATFSDGFFGALHDRYKGMRDIEHLSGLLHGNFNSSSSLKLVNQVLCVAVAEPDESTLIGVPQGAAFDTTFQAFATLDGLARDAAETYEDRAQARADFEEKMESETGEKAAFAAVFEHQQQTYDLEKRVADAPELREKQRARSARISGKSVLAITFRDIVALLSVGDEPVCVVMELHQHAAVWTASLQDGIVVVEPRDPGWTSLQTEEFILQIKHTHTIDQGWCATWQAFDFECILADKRDELAALKQAAAAYCTTDEANPTMQQLARSLGDVDVKHALSILVRYLFLRNVELLVLCAERHPQYLRDRHKGEYQRREADFDKQRAALKTDRTAIATLRADYEAKVQKLRDIEKETVDRAKAKAVCLRAFWQQFQPQTPEAAARDHTV